MAEKGARALLTTPMGHLQAMRFAKSATKVIKNPIQITVASAFVDTHSRVRLMRARLASWAENGKMKAIGPISYSHQLNRVD